MKDNDGDKQQQQQHSFDPDLCFIEVKYQSWGQESAAAAQTKTATNSRKLVFVHFKSIHADFCHDYFSQCSAIQLSVEG